MKNEDYINVGTNKCEITNNDNKIIGCNSLITCIGILLYSEKYKIAGLLHKSIDGDANDDYIKQRNYNLLIEFACKLEQEIVLQNGESEDKNIKYLIIQPAIYTDKTVDYINLYESLLKTNGYVEFSNEELSNVNIMTTQIGENELVNNFAFDASTGNFVTKEIFKEEFIDIMNIKRR